MVWDVYPTLAERRLRNAGPPPGVRERRHQAEWRPHLQPDMARGWLAFEADNGERRRLAPIPETPHGWNSVSEGELRNWCSLAAPAPRVRRLIE